MKIILESELERYAWEEMIPALTRWERHNGRTLRDYMEWWMEDLNKDQTEAAIKAEVERRLEDEYSDDLNTTEEEEYVAAAMSRHEDPDKLDYDLATLVENPEEERERMRKERQEWAAEYRQEYRDLQAEIADRREELMEEIKEKLRRTYCMFFSDLEDLTILFDGEVIHGK